MVYHIPFTFVVQSSCKMHMPRILPGNKDQLKYLFSVAGAHHL